MAVYVISDIHGEYDLYQQMLEMIDFADDDTLYVLGDVVDRGPHPMRVMLDMMKRPNVIPVVGNHELLAIRCLQFLNQEVWDIDISEIDSRMLQKLLSWQKNGAVTTIREFHDLDPQRRQAVIDYMLEFDAYAELTVSGRRYVLVHAGFHNFRPDRSFEDYTLNELVWERPDYEKWYFHDRYVITGHTPTMTIKKNPKKGYIYRHHNHIVIDCGACFEGGRLGCLCLDTDQEFYIEREDLLYMEY